MIGARPSSLSARLTLVVSCLALAVTGCDGSRNADVRPDAPPITGPAAATRARFRDVAAQAKVRFTTRNGVELGHQSILESLGAGVGLLDYDRDGWVDVFLPGGGTYSSKPEPVGLSTALFRNRGHGPFEDVSAQSAAANCPFYSHGVNVGDIDSDGFSDLLISGYHGLLLYRNQGDGTFRDDSAEAGLSSTKWSTSTAWGDANGDGVLDLYVANYVDWSFQKHPVCQVQGHRDICPPKEFDAQSDVFYLGNGDGTFRDATAEVGLVPGGKGLGVLAADLDVDGDVDYYVANDTTPNFLYRNDGHGRFQEVALLSGTAFGETGEAEGSMGVDVGDYNNDGLPDLWVANFENQSFALYRNEGDCHFQHVSAITGITAVGGLFVGFGTVFFDFDADGDEDLFATNGHVMNHPSNAPLLQRPLLFENLDGKRFVNVADGAGEYMRSEHLGRGVASVDLDQDGAADLVVSHTNQPVAILKNESLDHGSWLRVRLVGIGSHRDAVGARVTVSAGGRKYSKQAKGGSSYLSSPAPELLFGLAKATKIDAIEVAWPGGQRQVIAPPAINSAITIFESAKK